MNELSVTVLGLGAMGGALARTFLEHGHTTTVWNRSPAKAAPLVALGARHAGTVADAMAASDLVVLCLTGHDAVMEVLAAGGAAAAGRTVVDFSTGTPDEARETAATAGEHGAAHLGAVIQASPADLGTPGATLIYSGPARVFADCRPALEPLGTTHHAGGDPGQAGLYDLALLGLWYDTTFAYLNSLALAGGGGGVPPETFAPFAAKQMGYVVAAAEETAREVRDRAYPRGPASLTEHAPVLEHLVRLRASAKLGTAQLEELLTFVERRIADGRGEEGFTGIVEELAR
ncbi:NAD(P)-dependent oxidoreductase [Nonomuraea longispora]|uniref:NAD(P)-dependent oxidoreductase n=1 Tax=Nonomuraea longispora TaxID=1848320 RepID=A0A4R4N073_9ACTN|nr:NAD(P)-binding domain-containing protein [Nonomuraea longispora]TDC02009.1 NAD(P)-dependent oxidoreductase [Nonomuraea longispora]